MTFPFPPPRPHSFSIALFAALVIHSLIFYGLDLTHMQPKPVKKKPKPLIIEFIGKPLEEKTHPIPEITEILAEIDQTSADKSALPVTQPTAITRQIIAPPQSVFLPKKKLKQKRSEPTPVMDFEQIKNPKEIYDIPTKLNLSPSLGNLAQWDQRRRIDLQRSSREISLDLNTKKIKYAAYFGIIKQGIRDSWTDPLLVKHSKTTRTLLLSFSIDKHGKLINIVILRPSGREILDQAAIDAIRRAAPFPPLPGDWQLERLNISTAFEYVFKNDVH